MGRGDRAAIATFVVDSKLSRGSVIALDDDGANHARVLRLKAGARVRLLDGAGSIADGTLGDVAKRGSSVSVGEVMLVSSPRPLDVCVPIADRDRMLLAAEKSVELQVTGWQPILFARSRSVSPRGEGERFRDKTRSRMRSALEQSEGAWLPRIYEEAPWSDAASSFAAGRTRILLDPAGEPLARLVRDEAIALAVGPEGGLELGEMQLAHASGWRLASLGSSILRFETAIIAAAAVVRALQAAERRT